MASEDFDLYIGNDNTINLRGVRDGNSVALNYINNATVVATLYDRDGNEVPGQTWPTSLGYIAASNGDYQGNLDDSLRIGERSGYTLEIEIDAGGDNKAKFRRSGRGVWR